MARGSEVGSPKRDRLLQILNPKTYSLNPKPSLEMSGRFCHTYPKPPTPNLHASTPGRLIVYGADPAQGAFVKPIQDYVGGCQNYDSFLGTLVFCRACSARCACLNFRCHIRIGIQKGTIILTTTHIQNPCVVPFSIRVYDLGFGLCHFRGYIGTVERKLKLTILQKHTSWGYVTSDRDLQASCHRKNSDLHSVWRSSHNCAPIQSPT